MRQKAKFLLTSIFALIVLRPVAADEMRPSITGAQIDESNLRAIFVSPTTGNNSNAGSRQKPFATIERAIAQAVDQLKAGVGSRIVLLPGVYRESGLVVDGSALGDAVKNTTLAIEASEDGGVEWKGSKLCSDFEPVDKKLGLYRIPWNLSDGDPEVGPLRGPSDRHAPQSLIPFVKDGEAAVTLTWAPPSEGHPTGYLISRASLGPDGSITEAFHQITPSPITALSYRDDGVPPVGMDYHYRVTAVDKAGTQSPPSNQARVSWVVRYIPNTLGRRSEMVFVDGQLMRQVASKGELGLNTFWVDDGSPLSSQPGYLYLVLGPFKIVPKLYIEVAGSRTGARLLTIRNKNNLVIRGIDFSQTPSRSWNDGALTIQDGQNILIEKNTFHENNDCGVAVNNLDHLTFRENLCHDNGGGGVVGGTGIDQIWENNQCSSNGWRSTILGGQDIWFSAGIKSGFGLRNAVFRNNTMSHNACLGFWLDTDMENILIENMVCTDNVRSGMWLEASHGPCIVRNSVFRGNHYFGILLGDAGGISLEGNRVEDNFPAQICIGVGAGASPGRPVVDRDDGKTYQSDGRNISWTNNTIAALKADQMLVSFSWGNLPAYQTFLDGFRGSGNRYWHPSSPLAFSSPLAGNFLKMSLEEWRRMTGGGTPQDTEVSGTKWQRPDDISSLTPSPAE